MTTPLNPSELAYNIQFWEDRLGIEDQRVLIALVADHMQRMNDQMSASFSEDLDEMGRRLAVEKAQQTSNIAHILRLKLQFEKLSKGFPIQASDLVGYFDRGKVLHEDMRRAIQAPDEVPDQYPSALVPLSFIFIRSVRGKLQPDFWEKTPYHREFNMAVTHMNDEVLGHLDPHMSALLCYFHHRRMGQILNDMVPEFKARKTHNWVKLADILSKQNMMATQELFQAVQTQIQGLEKPQSCALKLPPLKNS